MVNILLISILGKTKPKISVNIIILYLFLPSSGNVNFTTQKFFLDLKYSPDTLDTLIGQFKEILSFIHCLVKYERFALEEFICINVKLCESLATNVIQNCFKSYYVDSVPL